jgi:hypothetical protein
MPQMFEDAMAIVCPPGHPEETKIVKAFVLAEMDQALTGTIMRGNTTCVHLVSSFLTRMLEPMICESSIVAFLEKVEATTVELDVGDAQGLEVLRALTLELIRTLSSESCMEEVLEPARHVLEFVAEKCDEKFPNTGDKWPLLGGLVLLRVVCPALATPSKLLGGRKIGPVFQKNLLQIVRLLQNLSNHQPFKEGANAVHNTWLREHFADLEAYLGQMCAPQGPELPAAMLNFTGPKSDWAANKLAHLAAMHWSRIVFPPDCEEFRDLLQKCGDPQDEQPAVRLSKTLIKHPDLSVTRSQTEAEFVAQYPISWPSDFIRAYFAQDRIAPLLDNKLSPSASARVHLVKLHTLVNMALHADFGVCVGPEWSAAAGFPVSLLLDWMMQRLKLPARGYTLLLAQDMADQRYLLPAHFGTVTKREVNLLARVVAPLSPFSQMYSHSSSLAGKSRTTIASSHLVTSSSPPHHHHLSQVPSPVLRA